MPARQSRWKAQHAQCQKAVDNIKADLTQEIERLQAHVEALDYCLEQARAVLNRLSKELPDSVHRHIAAEGLSASAVPAAIE